MRWTRPIVLALAVAVLAAVPASDASAQVPVCPGAEPACPYVGAGVIGQRSGGVLRFPQAVAVGPDGSVFVGDQGSHVVSVFGPDGTFRREIGVPGTRPGELSAVGALAVSGDGTLFVAEGRNRIDRFSPAGTYVSTFGKSGTGIGEFRFGGGRGNDAGAGGGLAVGGNFLFVSDSGNDRVLRFEQNGSGGAVIVPPGAVRNPKGLAVRKSRLLVADDQNHRVLAMDFGGRVLKSIGAAKGTKPGQLNFPYGVALDGPGRLFVADNLNHRVVRFSTQPNYPYKGRWGSYGTSPSKLAYPRGIATDGAGQVYVANTGNNRIEVFSNGGQLIRTMGIDGRGPGQFGNPTGVASDAQGFRAVTDSVNGRVQFFAPDGRFVTSWGSPAPGPTVLPRPVAVAFDTAGTAYVLDQRRARIVVFGRGSGVPVRSIGSQGSGPAQMRDPSAITISKGGTIYVADTGNKRIVRFNVNGQYGGAITDAGGVHGVALSPDGQQVYSTNGNFVDVFNALTGARIDQFGGTGNKIGKLNAPQQIATDGAGNLWVADRGNNRVQLFGPAGERLAQFGGRGGGQGQFINPTGVSVDCNGLLTVTDSQNNRVQQFRLAANNVAACTPLSALGNPKPPKLPQGPEVDGPQVTVRALRSSGLLGNGLPVRVGCDTGCSVAVTVRITPRAAPPKKKKRVTITLVAKKTTIAAGGTKIVRLKASKKQASSLRKALRGRRGVQVNVSAVGTAEVGSPTTVSQRLNGSS